MASQVAAPHSTEPTYADIAHHSPTSSNAVVDGPEPLPHPDTAESSTGLRRRRSDRLSTKAPKAASSDTHSTHGVAGDTQPSSSLGLNIAAPGSTDVDGDSDNEKTAQAGEADKADSAQKKGRKGSRIDLSMSNARKRVAEGLKSPLLGGMKLDQLGESITKGVEIK